MNPCFSEIPTSARLISKRAIATYAGVFHSLRLLASAPQRHRGGINESRGKVFQQQRAASRSLVDYTQFHHLDARCKSKRELFEASSAHPQRSFPQQSLGKVTSFGVTPDFILRLRGEGLGTCRYAELLGRSNK